VQKRSINRCRHGLAMNTHTPCKRLQRNAVGCLMFFFSMEMFLSLTYDVPVAMTMNIGGNGMSFHVVWEDSAGFSE